jgi:predicted aldo/keto reductase-like oxidoreductase
MSREREVEENVAVAAGLSLTADELREVERMRSDLDERTCRRCRYCEPCPNGVSIFMLMMSRSFASRVGTDRLAAPRFQEVVASAANCTECGTCVERCPYSLPVPELVREAVEFCRAISGSDTA